MFPTSLTSPGRDRNPCPSDLERVPLHSTIEPAELLDSPQALIFGPDQDRVAVNARDPADGGQ